MWAEFKQKKTNLEWTADEPVLRFYFSAIVGQGVWPGENHGALSQSLVVLFLGLKEKENVISTPL